MKSVDSNDKRVAGTIEPVAVYPVEEELAKRIDNLIAEYSGEISNVSVIGILSVISASRIEG